MVLAVIILSRSPSEGWNVTIHESGADVNGDHPVDLKDVALITCYLAGDGASYCNSFSILYHGSERRSDPCGFCCVLYILHKNQRVFFTLITKYSFASFQIAWYTVDMVY